MTTATGIQVGFLAEELENYIPIPDKCGEVFVTKKGIFSCVCLVCKQNFEQINHFTEHILRSHLEHDITLSQKLLILKQVNDKNTDIYNKTVTDSDKLSSKTTNQLDGYITTNCLKTSVEKNVQIKSNKIIFDPLDLDYEAEISANENEASSATGEIDIEVSVAKEIDESSENSNDDEETSEYNGIKIDGKLHFICEICNRSYKLKHAFIAHKNRHLNPPFKCEHCQKTFLIKKFFVEHIRIHTGEKPYKCKNCPAAFAVVRNLNRHSVIHSERKKTFVCNFGCGKAFYGKIELTAHRFVHIGRKNPFVCEICGSVFQIQSHYIKHKIRVHMDKKDRPYKCDQCDEACVTRQELKLHAVIHTREKPFACDQCPRRFGRASGLYQHKELHSSIKKHVCTICNKAFQQACGLYCHMKTHGIGIYKKM